MLSRQFHSPLATLNASSMQYHLFDTTTRWQRMSVLIELGGAALDDFKDRDATLTIATRRLEPDRRSPSGHTYNRLVYLGRDSRQTLEQVRRQVETGDWKVAAPRK